MGITGVITHTDTTESTSKTTGAIKTAGGVGIAKNIHVGGTADVTGTADITGDTQISGIVTAVKTTQTTTSTTGAIVTAGGVGIAKNIHLGGTADVTGTARITGNVGIGEAPDGTKALVVNGVVRGMGAYQDGSDRRWKKNILQLRNSLSKVLNITGVSFDWRRRDFPHRNFPERGRIGFIAQDLEEVVPEVVSTDNEGWKTVAYSSLAPMFVEAIKEQQRIIESQQQAAEEQQHAIGELQKVNKQQQEAIDHLLQRLTAVEAAAGGQTGAGARTGEGEA